MVLGIKKIKNFAEGNIRVVNNNQVSFLKLRSGWDENGRGIGCFDAFQIFGI